MSTICLLLMILYIRILISRKWRYNIHHLELKLILTSIYILYLDGQHYQDGCTVQNMRSVDLSDDLLLIGCCHFLVLFQLARMENKDRLGSSNQMLLNLFNLALAVNNIGYTCNFFTIFYCCHSCLQ